MWTLYAALIVTLAVLSTAPAEARTPADNALKVMSFNIRNSNSNDGENGWDHRHDFVMEFLRAQKPDVIGMQEVLQRQKDDLEKALPEYEPFGIARDDAKTKGEYSLILTRRDRFKRLDGGNFWLSDTPETVGSKSWGNRVIRICSWARLKDRRTGRAFYFYNLHLDHESQFSREKAMQLVVDRIRAREHPDPVILTGDFNAGEANPAVTLVKESTHPVLRDTFRVAHPDEKEAGTFHGFSGKPGENKIDYIFVTEEWAVEDARILRDNKEGRYPSDHFPIDAVLRFKDAK
jgi:endonuclease/exonuclease/phosphatase family metal-dependent hydrolase